MKTILVSIAIIFGIVPLMAQEDYVSELPAESTQYTSASNTVLNQPYLNAVQALETPKKASHLQKLVAAWNPAQGKKHLKRKKTISAVASSNSSKIQVTYSADGDLTSTEERYKNVALPLPIRNTVYTLFPGWEQLKNKYHVCYTKGETVQAHYVVVLKHEGRRKTLKLDAQGQLL